MYLTGFLVLLENLQGTRTWVSSTFLKSPRVTDTGYQEKSPAQE